MASDDLDELLKNTKSGKKAVRYCILNAFDRPELEKELLYYIDQPGVSYDDIMVLGPSVGYPTMRVFQN